MPRDILDHPRFKDGDWLKVWLFLAMNASFRHRRILRKGKPVALKPGELWTTTAEIALATGADRNKIERVLAKMQGEKRIQQRENARR